jgi:hypothetical protein
MDLERRPVPGPGLAPVQGQGQRQGQRQRRFHAYVQQSEQHYTSHIPPSGWNVKSGHWHQVGPELLAASASPDGLSGGLVDGLDG